MEQFTATSPHKYITPPRSPRSTELPGVKPFISPMSRLLSNNAYPFLLQQKEGEQRQENPEEEGLTLPSAPAANQAPAPGNDPPPRRNVATSRCSYCRLIIAWILSIIVVIGILYCYMTAGLTLEDTTIRDNIMDRPEFPTLLKDKVANHNNRIRDLAEEQRNKGDEECIRQKNITHAECQSVIESITNVYDAMINQSIRFSSQFPDPDVRDAMIQSVKIMCEKKRESELNRKLDDMPKCRKTERIRLECMLSSMDKSNIIREQLVYYNTTDQLKALVKSKSHASLVEIYRDIESQILKDIENERKQEISKKQTREMKDNIDNLGNLVVAFFRVAMDLLSTVSAQSGFVILAVVVVWTRK